jgi:hypothetical protein
MRFRASLSVQSNTEILKIVAVITMIIDHTGYLFFPEIRAFRIVGRIGFPIFAYLIALGYNRTSNYTGYLKRLIGFGIISMIPYYYFSHGSNVFFTLALGLIGVHYYKQRKYLIPVGAAIIAYYFDTSYGWYGVLTILLFSIFLDNWNYLIIAQTVLNLIIMFISHSTLQLYSLLALFVVSIDFDTEVRLPKYFYYWFYPVHIGLLLIIKGFV